jgi:hypothetical protein
MTSFNRLQLRIADETLPPYRRLSHLRSCLEHFAPYGLRSTYMYLTLSAAIPRDLTADPTSLVRAADELGAARARWLSGLEPVLQRRREQKAAGNRTPARGLSSHGRWGPVVPGRDDARRRPPATLMDFVERRLRQLDGVRLPGCPDCGGEVTRATSTGHGFVERCAVCDLILTACVCGSLHPGLIWRHDPWWPEIWRRRHLDDAGRPDPGWPGWDLDL